MSQPSLDSCAICLEEFKISDNTHQTECGHKFHKKCLGTWFRENQSCPLCRNGEIEFNVIYQTSKLPNSVYKFKDLEECGAQINGKRFPFVRRNLLNKHACPCGWMNIDGFPQPLFFLEDAREMPNKIRISFRLRLCIIFAGQDRNVIMRKTEDETGEIYYDTDDLIFSGEQHNDFINIYNWVFEVIKELKREYDFRYPSLMNPLIMDLFLMTAKHFELLNQRSKLQTIIGSAIHSAIKFLVGKEIPVSRIRYYTDFSSRSEDIDFYNHWIYTSIINNKISRIDSASLIRALYRE